MTVPGGSFTPQFSYQDRLPIETPPTQTLAAYIQEVGDRLYAVSVVDWTPDVTFATPGDFGYTASIRRGSVTKVGRKVTAHFEITTSSWAHSTASGALHINGLPFTVSPSLGTLHMGTLQFGGITKAGYTQFVSRAEAGTTRIVVLASASGQASSAVSAADMPSGGSILLRGTVEYITDT